MRIVVAAFVVGALLGCQSGNQPASGPEGSPSPTLASAAQAGRVAHSTSAAPGSDEAAASGSAVDNLALAHYQPVPVEYARGASNGTKVALTFDAGAYARGVPLLLSTLQQRHLRATFFLTGQFCKDYPKQARAIADAGMELGNHSFSHPYFTKLSDDAIRKQLDDAEATIVKTCGRGAKPLFRFPFGDSNKRVIRVVAAAGYQPINWTWDSLDSLPPEKSADYIAARINRVIKPGYITLMHVAYTSSAEALPRILDHLDALGLQTVPVSELLLSHPPGGKSVPA